MTARNNAPTDLHCADDRTGLLHVEEGVVLYDVENPTAWIQSDQPVSLDQHR